METARNPCIAGREERPRRPLSIPEEIWCAFDGPMKGLYRRAQGVLDVLEVRGESDPATLCSALGTTVGELHASVRLLEEMSLVEVLQGPVVRLIALPEDPVPFVSPDGRVKWIFVARPMVAPEVAPDMLN